MILSLRIYWPFLNFYLFLLLLLLLVVWVLFTKSSLRLFPFWYHLHTVIRYYCKCQLCGRNYVCIAENFRMKFTVLSPCQEYIEHCLLSPLQMVILVPILVTVSSQKVALAWEVILKAGFSKVVDPRFSREARRGQGLLGWKRCCAVTIYSWHHVLIMLLSNMVWLVLHLFTWS